jgi:DNA-directed RNA polymerase subunit M/transcription elongation factor TFIIS
MNKIRDDCYNHLNKMLGSDTAKIIEKSIYNFSKEYNDDNGTQLLEQIYQSKSEELLKLIGKNLKFILDSIKHKTIDLNMIAFMRSSELNIKKSKDIEIIGTNAFECDKCKKSNSTVIEKQVRSGDEPATQFITCLECGNVYTRE